MKGVIIKILIVLFYSIFAIANVKLYKEKHITLGELFVENGSFFIISLIVILLKF